MEHTNPYCLICSGQEMKKHHYAPNRFKGKTYHYYRCVQCNSLSIYPIPEQEDFDCIYGLNDHSYLNELTECAKIQYQSDYPKYHHQKYQIDFFQNDIPLIDGYDLLDYGCGNGFYMDFAESLGFNVWGIEHDKEFTSILRKKTSKKIHTIDELKDLYPGKKFDIIHTGHVLEHLTHPEAAIQSLYEFSRPNTIWIFDGPLEYNFCLSRWAVEIASKINRKTYNEHAPQHLSFTNHRAQKLFFENLGFKTLKYEIREQSFPFPATPTWRSFSEMSKFILSRTSICLSMFFPSMGNIFHYTGKLIK